MQNGGTVAYYSQKLNPSQKNYTTTEKELLIMVGTLKDLRSMLLGAEITVLNNFINLTFYNLTLQQVMRWRIICEEYSHTFK